MWQSSLINTAVYLKVLHGLKTRAPLYRAIVPIQRCEFTTKAALFGTTSLRRVDWTFIYKTLLLMAETQGGRWCKIGTSQQMYGTKPTAKSTVEKHLRFNLGCWFFLYLKNSLPQKKYLFLNMWGIVLSQRSIFLVPHPKWQRWVGRSCESTDGVPLLKPANRRIVKHVLVEIFIKFYQHSGYLR